MTQSKNINISCIENLISEGVNISYGNISIESSDERWVIEYESYFNPHAKPYSLKDKKVFDNALDAAKFFCSYIQERNQD